MASIPASAFDPIVYSAKDFAKRYSTGEDKVLYPDDSIVEGVEVIGDSTFIFHMPNEEKVQFKVVNYDSDNLRLSDIQDTRKDKLLIVAGQNTDGGSTGHEYEILDFEPDGNLIQFKQFKIIARSSATEPGFEPTITHEYKLVKVINENADKEPIQLTIKDLFSTILDARKTDTKGGAYTIGDKYTALRDNK